jgi:hypothetical protein
MRDGWQRRRPAAGDHHDRCRRVPADGVRSSATSRSSARFWPNGATTSRVCRNNYVQAGLTEHRGVRLRRLPTAGIKHLNAIVHSGRATSVSVALASWFDLLHNHALDPGVVGALPRYLSPAKVVLTVHGLNDQCAEWGRGAGTCYGRPAGGAAGRGCDHPGLPRPGAAFIDSAAAPGRLCPHLLLRPFLRITGNTRLLLVGGRASPMTVCGRCRPERPRTTG